MQKKDENNLYKINRTALPCDTKRAVGDDMPENFALLFNRMGHLAEKEKLEKDKPRNFKEGKDLVKNLLDEKKEIKFHFFHKRKEKNPVTRQSEPLELDLTKKWKVNDNRYNQFKGEYTSAIQSLYPTVELFNLKADWRIALGMGNASVYENGFTFHPTYGIPYLPGSSLKGMTRHWAVAEGEDKKLIEQIFGHENDTEVDSEDFRQGQIVFFDALPVELTQGMAQPDIMNNHYPEYYEGKKFPADWLSPRPIFFLTMKEVAFQFHLGYIPRANESGTELLDKAKTWLLEALEYAGVGAKTAVGYGRMRDKSDTYTPPSKVQVKREPQFKLGPKDKKLKSGDEFEGIVTSKPSAKDCIATIYGYSDKKYEEIRISGSISDLDVGDVIKIRIEANGKIGTKIISATYRGSVK